MTAADTVASAPQGRDWRLPLVLSIALRELRSGFAGFRIFIACVALGVTVITGVGAVSDALRAGFERQGEAILGGDVTVSRTHVRAVGSERAVARAARAASARRRPCAPWRGDLDGADQALAELKGVDAAYPLVGKVALADGRLAAGRARARRRRRSGCCCGGSG